MLESVVNAAINPENGNCILSHTGININHYEYIYDYEHFNDYNYDSDFNIELNAKDSFIILAYHNLIKKLSNDHGWIIDCEHTDTQFRIDSGIYQHSAARYFDVDSYITPCTIELILSRSNLKPEFISVSLGERAGSIGSVVECISLIDLHTYSIDALAYKVDKLLSTLLSDTHAQKISEIKMRDIAYDTEIIKLAFIYPLLKDYETYPPITDIKVVAFKSWGFATTLFIEYIVRNRNWPSTPCMIHVSFNRYRKAMNNDMPKYTPYFHFYY